MMTHGGSEGVKVLQAAGDAVSIAQAVVKAESGEPGKAPAGLAVSKGEKFIGLRSAAR